MKEENGIMMFLEPSSTGTTKVIDEEHKESLLKMKLHGNYFENQANIPNVDTKLSNQWLLIPSIRNETESLLCAAQEQTLATNYLQKKIWGNSLNSKCRLCKEQDETVHHIVSGCKMLCGTQYKYRHDQICKYIHWNIL